MKGSFSTPGVPEGDGGLPAPSKGPFVHRWRAYGDERSSTFDPSTFATPVVATQLGSTWLAVLSEVGRHDSALKDGLRRFLIFLADQVAGEQQATSFAAKDLRRSHLDRWELSLLADHRAAKTDTHYRYVIYLFALLSRYEMDHPGTLHHGVKERLEQQPRLWHHRNEGLPPLTEDETTDWRRWAYRKVRDALALPDRGIADIDVQTATHVLLSLATGEPPEVVRAITVDDIEATTSPEADAALPRMSPAARLAYLSEHNLVELFRVRYTKNRSHETYDEVYAPRDHDPFRAFRWALMLNAAARDLSSNRALILMETSEGIVRQPPWHSVLFRLDRIAQRNALPLSGPNHWARLRKTVTTREALANPRTYLAQGRRHSAETFLGHYTNSPVLRAEAGRVLVEGVDSLFDRAINGPTVVTPQAEAAMCDGAEVPGMDTGTVDALLAGQLDGPHAGCRDPLSSPYDEAGTPCTKSLTGTCFGCPNALVTRHHLPAALALQELADPDRAADPQVWLAHWKHIYDTITTVILPAFTEEDIEDARQRAHLTPLNLGTLNDMREPPEGPEQ